MARFVLSPAAERDILSILAWTHQQFGENARLRYEALLGQAILDVAEDPERIGVTRREEIREGAFTYHLWHSRLPCRHVGGPCPQATALLVVPIGRRCRRDWKSTTRQHGP